MRLALGSLSLASSTPTFDEFVDVLVRPRFDRLISHDVRRAFLEAIEDQAEWFQIEGRIMGCRDPKDDKFIETALVGRADCLVTGDRDLLALRPAGDAAALTGVQTQYLGFAIVTPAEFLALVGGST